MDELGISALKGLIAAGPACGVLAVIAWKLWGKVEKVEAQRDADRAEYTAFLRGVAKGDFDGDGKPG